MSSIVGAETLVLRGPILIVRWLLVCVAALVWIVFVPVVDVLRDVLRSLSAPMPLYRGQPR